MTAITMFEYERQKEDRGHMRIFHTLPFAIYIISTMKFIAYFLETLVRMPPEVGISSCSLFIFQNIVVFESVWYVRYVIHFFPLVFVRIHISSLLYEIRECFLLKNFLQFISWMWFIKQTFSPILQSHRSYTDREEAKLNTNGDCNMQ